MLKNVGAVRPVRCHTARTSIAPSNGCRHSGRAGVAAAASERGSDDCSIAAFPASEQPRVRLAPLLAAALVAFNGVQPSWADAAPQGGQQTTAQQQQQQQQPSIIGRLRQLVGECCGGG